MSRRTTIILAVLLFAGLAVAIFVGTPEVSESEIPALFLEFARADVKSIELRNPSGEVRLERDAKDRERWRLKAGSVDVRAASEQVEELLHDLSRMTPRKMFKATEIGAGERKQWGVESPGISLRLGLEKGEVKAAFGAESLEKQNAFAEKEPNSDVYVVPSDTVARLKALKTEALREKQPVKFSTYEAKTLEVRRADGMILSAQKASGGTWEVTVPYRGAADPLRLEDVLAKALNVEVVEFVADGAPDLDRYGLVEPKAVITVRREGREQPLVLKLGKETSDGGCYFLEEGEPSVYVCRKDLPQAVAALDPAAMRDRNLLRIGWARIDSIEFTHEDAPWKLLRVLERWDVEKPERVPADMPRVDALLAEFRELEILEFLDGDDPEKHGLHDPAKAVARLLLVGIDETGTRTLLLGKRDDQGRLAVRLLPPKDSKERTPVVLVPGAFMDRLLEGRLSFRSLEVMKVDLADVRGLSRKTAVVEEAFLYEKGVWKAAPGGKEPDVDALTQALTHLLTLNASGFEAKTKEGLERWGLGEPPSEAVVTVRLAGDGKSKTLMLGGAPEGGGSHYARMADGDLVFRLPDNVVRGADVVHFFDVMARNSWAKAPKVPETPPPAPAPGPGEEPKKPEVPPVTPKETDAPPEKPK